MLNLFNYNIHTNTAMLRLKVRAAGKINKIDRFIFSDNKAHLKITIKTVPEQGKANVALIDFLSAEWKIQTMNFEIINGSKSNLKLIEIKNIKQEYLNSIFSAYI